MAVQTDNAAFEDDPLIECARILRRIADDLDNGIESGVARDVNGNVIGGGQHDE